MKQRLLALVLGLVMVVSSGICVYAMPTEKGNEFEVIHIPYVKEGEYNWKRVIKARYKDTKEPITLSLTYDDRLYATVPAENVDREIEAFETEYITFTDNDDRYYEFHIFEELSRTGVVKGNDNGEALPFENITRAEATAMLLRFLGLQPITIYGPVDIFEDVTSDDWYYREVLSAYHYGLVKGDSETTFSPERNVSREEFVVMAYRAAELAKLGLPGDDNMNATDLDKISDWAKDAYSKVGNYAITDVDNTDSENPVRVIDPQKSATRYDVASLLYDLELRCQMYPSQIAEQFGFDEAMPVIDGSTSTYPFTEAVYRNLFSNGNFHPQKPEKHSKSHATYQRLINGEIDMSFASVYPASDILAMAEEKGVELELIPIAYDAMIFFTNKDNPIEGLTSEQISNIYVNDAYENWNEIGGPDALLYPYCRNNDSGSHAQMEKHFLNGNEINANVQRETSKTMSDILTDVIAAKTEQPLGYGLGYSIYYYYHNVDAVLGTKPHLKLLAIDGVYPNDDTIADGSYPLSNNTYIAIKKDTPSDSLARKMAEFMLTETGQMCVEQAGFGKLKTNINDLCFADKLNSQMPIDKNYMFSPASIEMALMLALNGAEDETKTEIANALGYEINVDEGIRAYNEFAKDLITRYSQAENLRLDVANSIWLNEDWTKQQFSSDFKSLATEYYTADVKTVDNTNAVKEINAWASEKTNGKIPQVISSNEFTAMLVNAIYFKGAWQNEFHAGATKADTFENADGTKSQVDFMTDTAWLKASAYLPDIQVVELPYKNRFDSLSEDGEYLGTETFDDIDVSMYLMMSDRSINPEETLSELLRVEGFGTEYIKLSMPKFKIEYEASLNDMLKKMGVSAAFIDGKADFNKMFNTGSMFISDVIHKTYINVDEEGTEAAAVTAAAGGTTSAPPKPIEIKFNKPFYFIIRDNTSGNPLFIGRYAYGK